MRGKKIWVIILIIIIIADGGYFSSEYIKKKNKLNNYMGEITTYIADKEYDKAKETLEKAKALDLSNDELIGLENKLNTTEK